MKLLSVCCVCVVVCLLACSRKGLPQAGTITRADSSVVKKDSTWRDVVTDIDTVYLPGDTIKVETLIECDPVTNKPKDISVIVDGKHSKLEMTLRNGILKVKSKYDSVMQITINQKETIHHLQQELTRVNSQEKQTIIVEKFITHWYDIMARWLALIYILLIILYIIIKIKL